MKEIPRITSTTRNHYALAASLGIIGLAIMSVISGLYLSKSGRARVVLGNTGIFVTVADTPEKRARGLSLRKQLAPDEGMFFVFPDAEQYGFWMKDMLFPIDIIWFDANRQIVDVKKGAEPSSYPDVFTPNASSQYVLEVSAGFFTNHHLRIGDTLEIHR